MPTSYSQTECEIRSWALQILSATTLEEKLAAPAKFTDHNPGSPLRWQMPSRPPGMSFKPFTRKDRLPSFSEHKSLEKRAICLHRFAGHELLAVEIMAFALLAFPDASPIFRKGLANTLKEEQGHVRLYMNRMKEMGLEFGQLPLFQHFWSYTPHLSSPLHYISLMSLSLEMANLDFAPMYGASFAEHGDEQSAALMATILRDEIGHVAFGWNWLKKFKKTEKNEWNAWLETLPPKVLPSQARGNQFFAEHRKKAGLPDSWINQLEAARS